MESIKFSVIVPVYKVEPYIRECIESVLHQTYQNYELILVDDGSPDNSGLICDEYKEKSDQIVVYHKPNAGSLHTRIYGIAHATGDYYVFLDSDDSLKENALQVIYQAITKYSCDCVIYEMDRLYNGNYIINSADCIKYKCVGMKNVLHTVFVPISANYIRNAFL